MTWDYDEVRVTTVSRDTGHTGHTEHTGHTGHRGDQDMITLISGDLTDLCHPPPLSPSWSLYSRLSAPG